VTLRSCTVRCLQVTLRFLNPVWGAPLDGLVVDVGCRIGGLSKTIGECLRASEIYGMNIDEQALVEVEHKGAMVCNINRQAEWVPCGDAFFDSVCSFGGLDYFTTWDWSLRAICRVRRSGGYVCTSVPNLISYDTRLAVLLGYQPRDEGTPSEVLAGVHPGISAVGECPGGHINAVATGTFRTSGVPGLCGSCYPCIKRYRVNNPPTCIHLMT